MFESGLESSKAHSQVIIPFKTNTYSDVPRAEKGLVLKHNNFPYNSDQAIAWANAIF
jgi:hypothetical protein